MLQTWQLFAKHLQYPWGVFRNNRFKGNHHDKAKELQRLADEMVTLGKKGDLAARRAAAKMVRFEKDENGQFAIQKLFSEIAPKFQDRKGGYTRVLKTGPRRGDNAPMAIIQFVE